MDCSGGDRGHDYYKRDVDDDGGGAGRRGGSVLAVSVSRKNLL